MSEHDRLCMHYRDDEFHVDPSKCEYCRAIGETRADERQQLVTEGWVNPEAYKANVKILGEQGEAIAKGMVAQAVREERERIAAAIATREASAAQAYDETREQYWAGAWDAYDYAGQIARGER